MSTVEENKVVTGELIDVRLSNTPIVFHISDARIDELRRELSGMKIVDSADYARVTKGIGVCRTLRTQVEKCRKDLKEESLLYGRKVDAEAKRLTAMLEEIEEPLKAEKQRIDDEKEAAKKAAEEAKRLKIEQRINDLSAVNAKAHPLIVAEWSDEEFQSQLAKARAAFEEAERLAKIEAERLAKEEADRQEAMRQEQLRLDAERAELAKIRAEQEAAAKAERERMQAEREAIEAEKARLAREQFDRDESDRKKREAEELAERQRLAAIEAEEQRKAELSRLEALKPDKEKLLAFALSISLLEIPVLKTDEAKICLAGCLESLTKINMALKAFGGAE